MGDKDDNISIIETRKSKPLKNIKFAFEVNEMVPPAGTKCPGPQPPMRPPAAPEARLLAQGCPLGPRGAPSPSDLHPYIWCTHPCLKLSLLLAL